MPVIAVCGLAFGRLAFAQGFAEFEKNISDFALSNGLRFVVAERRATPLAAVTVQVNAGAAQDPEGKPGVARLFERLILHGSRQIGTQDWAKEKAALAEATAAWDRVEAARKRAPPMDPVDVQRLEVHAKMASEDVYRAARPSFVQDLMAANGMQTRFEAGADEIVYSFVMPAHRVEVCLKLVGEWLREPVFRFLARDLASAKAAVERRKREQDPFDRVLMLLAREAFPKGPYSSFGLIEPIEEIRAADADAFFKNWFTPENIVIAVSGNVSAPEIRKQAEVHFGKMTPRSAPPPTAESGHPAKPEEKKIVEVSNGPAVLGFGYRRPPSRHPDSPVLQVIQALLGGLDGGRLQQDLAEKRLAGRTSVYAAYPGRRHASLVVVAALAPSNRAVDVENEIVSALESLKKEPVEDGRLAAAKAWLGMTRLETLESIVGLSGELARVQADRGNWRKLTEEMTALDRVTAADIQRVASVYFVPERRVTVHLIPVSRAGE